jgi:hypothetical protein
MHARRKPKPSLSSARGRCTQATRSRLCVTTYRPTGYGLHSASVGSKNNLTRALLVYRLANNGDVAGGQLVVFQGVSEAPISGSYKFGSANNLTTISRSLHNRRGKRPVTIRGPLHVQCGDIPEPGATGRFRYIGRCKDRNGPTSQAQVNQRQRSLPGSQVFRSLYQKC